MSISSMYDNYDNDDDKINSLKSIIKEEEENHKNEGGSAPSKNSENQVNNQNLQQNRQQVQQNTQEVKRTVNNGVSRFSRKNNAPANVQPTNVAQRAFEKEPVLKDFDLNQVNSNNIDLKEKNNSIQNQDSSNTVINNQIKSQVKSNDVISSVSSNVSSDDKKVKSNPFAKKGLLSNLKDDDNDGDVTPDMFIDKVKTSSAFTFTDDDDADDDDLIELSKRVYGLTDEEKLIAEAKKITNILADYENWDLTKKESILKVAGSNPQKVINRLKKMYEDGPMKLRSDALLQLEEAKRRYPEKNVFLLIKNNKLKVKVNEIGTSQDILKDAVLESVDFSLTPFNKPIYALSNSEEMQLLKKQKEEMVEENQISEEKNLKNKM